MQWKTQHFTKEQSRFIGLVLRNPSNIYEEQISGQLAASWHPRNQRFKDLEAQDALRLAGMFWDVSSGLKEEARGTPFTREGIAYLDRVDKANNTALEVVSKFRTGGNTEFVNALDSTVGDYWSRYDPATGRPLHVNAESIGDRSKLANQVLGVINSHEQTLGLDHSPPEIYGETPEQTAERYVRRLAAIEVYAERVDAQEQIEAYPSGEDLLGKHFKEVKNHVRESETDSDNVERDAGYSADVGDLFADSYGGFGFADDGYGYSDDMLEYVNGSMPDGTTVQTDAPHQRSRYKKQGKRKSPSGRKRKKAAA